LVAAVTLTLGLLLVNQLELLMSVVSFGALTGFFLLHLSVIVHFAWRKRSRQWLRHLVLPGIGALVIGYVLISARAPVKVVGIAWMILGGLVLGWLKFRGKAPLVQATLSP
jgi:amino acid transporter